MIITGMDHFQSVCKKKLVEWCQKHRQATPIDLSNVFIVWSCKTLQNYKCLVSTTVSGNGIYAEYFVEPYPARSAVEVAKLPKGALIEVEVIAKK